MQLYWTYISVLCISGHIAVKYLHYSRHRRGEFAKCPQSKNNKEQSISLSLPFYEMTWGRRWFYCQNVESPELSASFSESFNVAAFMKCILILLHNGGTDFLAKLSHTALLINHSLLWDFLKFVLYRIAWIRAEHQNDTSMSKPGLFCTQCFVFPETNGHHWSVDFAQSYILAFSAPADDDTY